MENNGRFKISIITFIAVTGAVFAYALGSMKPDQTQTQVSATQTQTQVQTQTAQTGDQTASTVATAPADMPMRSRMGMMSKYKDGTYSATGSYNSPGGYDQLGVTLTLKNGVVTAATVTNEAGDGRSSRYQDMFISGYKQYVIGQPIDNIRLDYVSGSSLTPIGFNDAVNQIKTQAARA